MKKIIITSLCVTLCFGLAFSQNPVIDREVSEDRESVSDSKTDTDTQFHFGYNLELDPSDSLNTMWSSPSLNIGNTYKFPIAKFYTLCITSAFQYDKYKINQDSINLLSPNHINEKQQLRIYTYRLGLTNRIHLGKHGVENGTYIDFGIQGSIRMFGRMFLRNEVDPKVPGSQSGEIIDTKIKKLQYLELLGYSATAAIGRNGVSLYGQYRLSNLFKTYEATNNGSELPEIAPLNLGLRIEF